MKFEDDWCKLIAILIVCSMIASIVGFGINHMNTKLFIENGYTRKTLLGYEYPQWVKE